MNTSFHDVTFVRRRGVLTGTVALLAAFTAGDRFRWLSTHHFTADPQGILSAAFLVVDIAAAMLLARSTTRSWITHGWRGHAQALAVRDRVKATSTAEAQLTFGWQDFGLHLHLDADTDTAESGVTR